MIRKAFLLALTLILITTISAGAQTDCSDHRAWPGGPHLSEKNDFIVNIFFGTWHDRACEKWVEEHKNSAIVGLRKLGYTITAPKEPVLKVDELTFRGKDNAQGQVTLGEGCYAIWLDTPDRTPDQLLAVHQMDTLERNQFWQEWGDRPIDFAINLWMFELADPENRTPIAASNRFGGIFIVDENISSLGIDESFVGLTPGDWHYQAQTSWRYPNTEWELRFIPIDYTLAPWDDYWRSFGPPSINPNAEASRCPA